MKPSCLGALEATPTLHSGVCVCVCVTYIYSTLDIFHTITDVNFLRLLSSCVILAIRQLRRLPCYTPTSVPHLVRVLELFSSYPPP